jgi:hypothetical protein
MLSLCATAGGTHRYHFYLGGCMLGTAFAVMPAINVCVADYAGEAEQGAVRQKNTFAHPVGPTKVLFKIVHVRFRPKTVCAVHSVCG